MQSITKLYMLGKVKQEIHLPWNALHCSAKLRYALQSTTLYCTARLCLALLHSTSLHYKLLQALQRATWPITLQSKAPTWPYIACTALQHRCCYALLRNELHQRLIALEFNTLHCTTKLCFALHCSALHCSAIHCAAMHRIHCKAPHLTTMQGFIALQPCIAKEI